MPNLVNKKNRLMGATWVISTMVELATNPKPFAGASAREHEHWHRTDSFRIVFIVFKPQVL